MTLVAFAFLISGIVFVMRTLHVFRERGLISEPIVTKIGIAWLALMNCAPFVLRAHPIGRISLQVALALMLVVVFFLLERQRLADFRTRIPIFLDRWILNLRLGVSVNAARDAALREECENFQALLRPIFETRGGDRDRHLLLAANMRREFEQISLSQHSSLARLENLRQILRKTTEFRRKSGQAGRQTAIQSSVMLVLVFAMAIYTVQRYGWTQSGGFITGSALLNVLGVLLMMHLARKSKWKF
jgi:Flp pilus assembly protein TadB